MPVSGVLGATAAGGDSDGCGSMGSGSRTVSLSGSCLARASVANVRESFTLYLCLSRIHTDACRVEPLQAQFAANVQRI